MRLSRYCASLLAGLAALTFFDLAEAAEYRSNFGGAAPPDQIKAAVTVEPNSYTSYYIDLPSNVDRLVATTSGPGNADLFVRQGIPHSATSQQGLIAESAGASTGPTSTESVTLQGSAITPGRWWLTVANGGSTALTVDLNADFGTSGSPVVATIGQSGTWFDPDKSLQGLFVQYLSSAQVFVSWFTFTPDGKQAYLFGIGTVDGDRIQIDNLMRTRGSRFGNAFDPAAVVSEDWGDLSIVFDACASGYASFLPAREGWPAEQLRIQQLTAVPGLPCGTSGKQEPGHEKYLGSSISGSWFNPDRPGEGWLVQALNDSAAVFYWFTFDPDGNQAWFGGVAQIVDGSLVLGNAVQPIGGRFGPDYSPSQVTQRPWGAFAMTLTGCTSSVLYSVGPDATWGDFGSEGLQRLTGVAGLPDCNLGASPLRLSGKIQPTPLAFQDGDTNNPDNPNIDNDSASQPQQVPTNPAIISGYATFAATGTVGDRFATNTDQLDGYRVTITAGQSLQLIISDWNAQNPTAVDLDLELYSTGSGAGLVQSAIGTERNEFLIVQQAGTYDVVVRAYAGSSNYVLVISNSPAPTQTKALSIEDRFVPDEIVLRFDEAWFDDDAPKSMYKSIAQRAAELGGLQFQRGQPGRPQLWQLPKNNRTAVLKALGANVDAAKLSYTRGWIMTAEQRERYELLLAIKALSGRADVRYVEPNYIAEAFGTTMKAAPNDPRYREQWHYPMINLPQAWDVTQGSADVVVAVIDTGVNPHPDLAANIRTDLGVDLIADDYSACDSTSGRDRDASDPGDTCFSGFDSSFHGTHVAGTVAAIKDNARGGAGVAPRTGIMPIRVLGRRTPAGAGTLKDISDGILWAAGEQIDGMRPSRAANVINLSLGGANPCPMAYQEALLKARAKGISVVVAAGNGNSSAEFSPADCDGVVKVAAINQELLPAYYSNCNNIDIAAPGGEVFWSQPPSSELFAPENTHACKAKPASFPRFRVETGVLSTSSTIGNPQGNNYTHKEGTSMAAPHVAGVIALMKAAHPDLTANDVDTLLAAGKMSFDPRNTGVTLPASVQNDYATFYGRGIIDSLAAVRAAKELAGAGSSLPPATIVAQPTSLDFGDTTQSLTFTLNKVGNGAAGIQSLVSTVPWLTTSGGGPDGLGQYMANANRSGLLAGEHSGSIRATTGTGANIDIPVRMRVGSLPPSGHSGAIYALLLDAITFRKVAQSTALLPQNGQATFSFQNVLPGHYYLVYGTNNDNDTFICDFGEYCGFYPPGESAGPLYLTGGNIDVGTTALFPDLSGLGEANNAASTKRAPPRVLDAATRIPQP